MNRTRIYVFLGTASALVDMMTSMDAVQLFSKGEYMVIFVDMTTYTLRYNKQHFTYKSVEPKSILMFAYKLTRPGQMRVHFVSISIYMFSVPQQLTQQINEKIKNTRTKQQRGLSVSVENGSNGSFHIVSGRNGENQNTCPFIVGGRIHATRRELRSIHYQSSGIQFQASVQFYDTAGFSKIREGTVWCANSEVFFVMKT